MTTFSADEVARFARDGYAIVRNLAPAASVAQMREVALAHLAECRLPVEYEADTRYPGAPASTDAHLAGARCGGYCRRTPAMRYFAT